MRKTISKQLPASLDIRVNIRRSNYVRIPDTNYLIAREQSLNGYDFDRTLWKAAEFELLMPEPRIFMPYFVNVNQALEGKITLYDGNNKPISDKEVEELHNRIFNNCWTWLNAKFIPGSGYRNLDIGSTRINTETKLLSRKNKNIESTLTEKITRKEPLKKCINEGDIFVDLVFNSQGLPTRKSKTREFKRGESIYFCPPIKDRVVWFRADSHANVLYCSWDLQYSDVELAVFLCAEGTPKN